MYSSSIEPTIEGYEVPEVRMSLKDAGALLGLRPNSVRSRYKTGKIRGEADNMGKLWVWVDPIKAISDNGSKEPTSKVSKESFEVTEINALKDHLKAMNQQLNKAHAEIADLRPQAMEAVRLKGEASGLREQQSRGEAEIARLIASLDRADAERRELIQAVLKRRLTLWERIRGSGKT